mmetsp:Transcript_45072/g.144384  ORF Transcript_45072/g.144384 Transcript_45072/m.144384 type:complete len:333 (-) Transcript_45072:301-1299(-)
MPTLGAVFSQVTTGKSRVPMSIRLVLMTAKPLHAKMLARFASCFLMRISSVVFGCMWDQQNRVGCGPCGPVVVTVVDTLDFGAKLTDSARASTPPSSTPMLPSPRGSRGSSRSSGSSGSSAASAANDDAANGASEPLPDADADVDAAPSRSPAVALVASISSWRSRPSRAAMASARSSASSGLTSAVSVSSAAMRSAPGAADVGGGTYRSAPGAPGSGLGIAARTAAATTVAPRPAAAAAKGVTVVYSPWPVNCSSHGASEYFWGVTPAALNCSFFSLYAVCCASGCLTGCPSAAAVAATRFVTDVCASASKSSCTLRGAEDPRRGLRPAPR